MYTFSNLVLQKLNKIKTNMCILQQNIKSEDWFNFTAYQLFVAIKSRNIYIVRIFFTNALTIF